MGMYDEVGMMGNSRANYLTSLPNDPAPPDQGRGADRLTAIRDGLTESGGGGVGNRLRRAREARGWDIKALSLASGIRLEGLYKYESGERLPGATSLVALAGALGVGVGWLVGEETVVVPKARWEELLRLEHRHERLRRLAWEAIELIPPGLLSDGELGALADG